MGQLRVAEQIAAFKPARQARRLRHAGFLKGVAKIYLMSL
jgi:hypothetical protein